MMELRPFRKMYQGSLEQFGMDPGEPKEPEREIEDWEVQDAYKQFQAKLDEARRNNRHYILNEVTMNGYPDRGTNKEKLKWLDDSLKRINDLRWEAQRWAYLNYGGRPPRGWRD